ncbi:MAG: hypothetical protein HY713_02885 [candidate division NC10 bacterium]|nr:hypothetical protein [candidate division NC10 bacterium]
MRYTGAEALWECLVREDVDIVWAYPGGAALPIFDAVAKYPQIHHVLVRHEQAAAHAADGYARATGRVGVCVATSGPGATNLVTGIAAAMLDSVPMVAITAQVADPVIGTDALQMNLQELATVAQERLPLKVVIMNNGYLGMVRQWQELFHGARYIGTPISGPDFVEDPRGRAQER